MSPAVPRRRPGRAPPDASRLGHVAAMRHAGGMRTAFVGGRRRWPRRARRAPFPLYEIEGWAGRRFVVEQDHASGKLAELTVGFADTASPGRTDVRVTTTRRPPSKTDERMARHLDPWLAAVVGEARGRPRLELIPDPEAVVELTSTWQSMTVPVDGRPVTFRVRCEDEAWVAYARQADHAVIVCVERAAALPPDALRLSTVRGVTAFEGGAATRRRRLGGRPGT